MKHLMMAIAIGLGLAFSAYAQTPDPGTIVVEHAWARAIPNGARTGAVTPLNHGAADDRLLGASTPMAEEVQFHAESAKTG